MMLLGRDPDRDTYHWEGPFGLPFESAPGRLYDCIRGWTRKIRHDRVLLAPEPRVDEPRCYLLDPDVESFRRVHGHDYVFVVVCKATGEPMFRVGRNFLFAIRENAEAPLDVMMTKESPYSVSAFRGGVNRFLTR